MTRPARSVTVTLRRPPRRRAAKPEAIVVGIPELSLEDETREVVAEALAALLLVVAEREGIIVLPDASQ